MSKRVKDPMPARIRAWLADYSRRMSKAEASQMAHFLCQMGLAHPGHPEDHDFEWDEWDAWLGKNQEAYRASLLRILRRQPLKTGKMAEMFQWDADHPDDPDGICTYTYYALFLRDLCLEARAGRQGEAKS